MPSVEISLLGNDASYIEKFMNVGVLEQIDSEKPPTK